MMRLAWFLSVCLAASAGAEIRIPERHPYLAMTAADVARVKERVAKEAWAKRVFDEQIARAERYVAKPWPKLGPALDREQRNVAGGLVVVGAAYQFTGERRYAEWVRDGLVRYSELYASLKPSRRGCRTAEDASLYEAAWLVTVVQAYDLVADSGLFTPAQRTQVESDLIRAAMPCVVIEDYEIDRRARDAHFTCYNFQAWHLAAAGLAGLALRDPELANYALNSPYSIRHLLAHDIRDDGMFWERSASYHQYVLSALIPLFEGMLHCGVDLYSMAVPADLRDEPSHYSTDTSKEPKSLRMMIEAPLYMAFPDLSYPRLGDCVRGTVEPSWLQVAGYHRYRSPGLAWLIARSGEAKRDWRWLLYNLPAESDGKRMPLTEGVFGTAGQYRNGCSLFPSTGLAVLREAGPDFPAQPDSSAVTLSFGPHGGGHGHPDKLNMIFYAQGRQWIPDFGAMPYGHPLKSQWSTHTVSHNEIVIDGVSQQPSGARDQEWPSDSSARRITAKLERFDPAAKVAAASTESAYEGFRLERSIQLAGHAAIDDFRVRPSAADSGAHQFDYVLHVAGEFDSGSKLFGPAEGKLGETCGFQHVIRKRSASATGPATVTFTSGKDRLRIWIVALDRTPTELIIADGPTDKPGDLMPMLIVRRKATSARFVSVIEPVKAGNEIRSVSLDRSSGSNALVLEFENGSRRIEIEASR